MTTHHTALALACFAGLSAACPAAEYVGSDVPGPDGAAPTPTDNLRRIPPSAYQPPRTGIPYGTIFRDTGAPYYNAMRDVQVNPHSQPSESLGFGGHVDVPDFRGSFPLLQRGFAPEDADLKIGPLYFKLRHLSAGVLYSDNIHQNDLRKESDTLAVFAIGGQIMAQLTEGFHIAISGNFVYLPYEGSEGLNGLSLASPYAFGLAGTPNANVQVAWEPVFFGLPFVIADEFTIGLARFSNSSYDSIGLFDGFETDSVDTAGIYTLRAPTVRSFSDSDRDGHSRQDFQFNYYSNQISINTGGPLPGQNVFRFRASHEDIWYEEEGSNLPSQRDRVFLGAESVRENLRFKPYTSYEMIRTADPDRLVHKVRFGVKGPVTDLLYFRGELGYFWDAMNSQNDNFIWTLAFRHTPDPRTRHSLVYQRDTSEFLDELDERLTYVFRRVLGPSLTTGLYASYHWIEDLDHIVPDRTEFRAGLTFEYVQSPRTSYRLTGQYADIAYDGGFGSYKDWTGRFECRHRFLANQNLLARLVYQYEKRDGDIISPDFSENLVFLSLSWLFE
jgi:hypothetical protein